MTFTPKSVEQIKSEVLTDLGVEYEGNETSVDAVVATRLKDEEFKASVHDQKEKHKTSSELYKQRLEQAGIDPETGEKKSTKVETEAPKSEGLTAKDVIALRDVHEEDVDYLLDEAKLRGKTVSELKNDPYMKIILKTKAEERATANATSTGTTRKSNTETPESLVEGFFNGKEATTREDFDKIAEAELEIKRKQTRGTK